LPGRLPIPDRAGQTCAGGDPDPPPAPLCSIVPPDRSRAPDRARFGFDMHKV